MLSGVLPLDMLSTLLGVLSLVTPVQVPNIIVIDGLDECGDAAMQIRILKMIRDAVQNTPYFPFRFLICSRPESWIDEAFSAEPLCHLSKVMVLDDYALAAEDIRRYCCHHFQEITSDLKDRYTQFPTPWPSEQQLQDLVDKSGNQFAYVATVFRFIRLGDNHPVDQLRRILEEGVPYDKNSPFRELDMLYQTILKASPNRRRVRDILAAILILPGYLDPTPAHLELLLGLPSGEVASTLRGMHSVLRIGGRADKIKPYHNSFRDFLLGCRRSLEFHIDVPDQRYNIAEQWLQQLTTSKIEAYR